MQNMVWSYCKRISPEWKQQVGSLASFPPRAGPATGESRPRRVLRPGLSWVVSHHVLLFVFSWEHLAGRLEDSRREQKSRV